MRTDIINRLIADNNYTSYLEIGVYDRVNYNGVKCKRKESVDPDARCMATHKITSDNFFRRNKKRYGLIFIDGLHYEEQAYRDINNALNALEPGGTIVVHDCNPTSEAMQQVPRIQGEWTGDVWRAWCRLRSRDDLKMFVYDCDYGVGIIQKGWQQPITITDPTFEQFMQNKIQWLNLIEYKVAPVSICIPAFDQYGYGVKMLTECLQSLVTQKGEYEIIVSDNSDGDDIKNLCEQYPVKYYRNPIKGISYNTNFVISKASHDLIKVMYQDDIALTDTMVVDFATALMHSHWVISNGWGINEKGQKYRVVNSQYSAGIIKGKNTIGMPSIVGFRRNGVQFDTNLKTLLDCEFYWLMNKKYGPPTKINKPLIGLRYWDGSTSRQQGNLSATEFEYLKTKWPELCE